MRLKNESTLLRVWFFTIICIFLSSFSSIYAGGEIGIKGGYRISMLEDLKSTSQNFSGLIGFNLGIFQLYVMHQIVKNQSYYNYDENTKIKTTETTNYTHIGSKLFLPISVRVMPYISAGVGRRELVKLVELGNRSSKDEKIGPSFSAGTGIKIALTKNFALEFSYNTIPTLPTENDENYYFDHIISSGITIQLP